MSLYDLCKCISIAHYINGTTRSISVCVCAVAGLADWNEPSGGMFLWLRVLGVKDSEVVTQKVLERCVVLVSGAAFTPNNQKSPYLRLSYTTISEEDSEKVCRAL